MARNFEGARKRDAAAVAAASSHRIRSTGVTWGEPESPAAARRAGVDTFDRYIIDEGQDVFESEILDKLEPSLDGGWSKGKWCIFYDVNNQAGLFGTTDLDTEAYLESLGAAKVPLTTNCRNTKLILDKVKNDLGADMGIRGAGNGPQIRELQAKSPEESATLLAKELKNLIKKHLKR